MLKKSLISLLFLLLITSVSYAETKDTFSITVKVYHLRNSKGIVQFALYNKDGSVPDEHFKKCIKIKKAGIISKSSSVTFYNLPEGKYAVNILHDENKNGKIDKGFILPIEGIGFTNYKSIGLTNRPNFKDASFYLDTDITKIVKVIYL